MEELNLIAGNRNRSAAGFGQKILDRTEHEGKRCSKFVADVAEECCLGPVNLNQCFRALLLLLIRAGVGNRRRDLRSDQLKKIAIELIQLQPNAYTRNHEAKGFIGAAGWNWNYDGTVRRIGPRTRRNIGKTLLQTLNDLQDTGLSRLDEGPG